MSENGSFLKERLLEAMKGALRAKDQVRLDTIRLVLAEIKNAEIDKRGPLGEEEIVALIRRGIKKREESIEYFEKGNRPELLEKARREIEVLKEFLPSQLSQEEIVHIVREVLHSCPAGASFGVVMKEVMAQVKGRAEGQVVSAVVRQEMNNMR
ncbi:MAG: GatB/YqeY domain-containing protein [Candidatus Atribacteria bacterium]|nr:GatB/YqeY domain-containing protein [Candidatus Atribacteria bacterium]